MSSSAAIFTYIGLVRIILIIHVLAVVAVFTSQKYYIVSKTSIDKSLDITRMYRQQLFGNSHRRKLLPVVGNRNYLERRIL